jgi:hypothetical protein
VNPVVSLNLTVNNQDHLLREELIIVLDSCNDDRKAICAGFIPDHPRFKIKLLKAPNVFETKAKNLAALKSKRDPVEIERYRERIDPQGTVNALKESSREVLKIWNLYLSTKVVLEKNSPPRVFSC